MLFRSQMPLRLNDITVSLGAPNPIGSLLALFREGMASLQPAYRFLCYYKIIEAWSKNTGPFEQVNKLFSDKGKVPTRRVFKVEPAMFGGKWEREKYEHLLGKKFGSCFEQMNEARRFLAHPFDSKGVFVSLVSGPTKNGSYGHQRRVRVSAKKDGHRRARLRKVFARSFNCSPRREDNVLT